MEGKSAGGRKRVQGMLGFSSIVSESKKLSSCVNFRVMIFHLKSTDTSHSARSSTGFAISATAIDNMYNGLLKSSSLHCPFPLTSSRSM